MSRANDPVNYIIAALIVISITSAIISVVNIVVRWDVERQCTKAGYIGSRIEDGVGFCLEREALVPLSKVLEAANER